jgi:sulfur relay protein TusB/DsrH
MINSICVVIKRPQGEEKSTLGLRMAWATYMAGFEVNILFIQDGVYNLLGNPGYNSDMLQNFVKSGGHVYALQSSLEERGLTVGDLKKGFELIVDETVANLICDFDGVVNF